MDDEALSNDSAWLNAETEAFLSGDFAKHMRRHGQAVPTWAYLNRLAHGDLRSVRQVRRPFSATRSAAFADRTKEARRSAQRVLVKELLELVGHDRELWAAVQRTVLVPLELQLIEEEAMEGVTALELVQCTRVALRSRLPLVAPHVAFAPKGLNQASISPSEASVRPLGSPETTVANRPDPAWITSFTKRQEQRT